MKRICNFKLISHTIGNALLTIGYIVLIYILLIMSVSVKDFWLDNIGDCIAKKGYKEGIVESHLPLNSFKGRNGLETNYHVSFRLDKDHTCIGKFTQYDYALLKDNEVIKAGDSSPLIYKLFGTNTYTELLKQLLLIFLLIITSVVFFALLLMLGKILHVFQISNSFLLWAIGSPKDFIKPKSNISFILIGMISVYTFVLMGVLDIGIETPFLTAIAITVSYSVLGVIYILNEGGYKYFFYNANFLGISSTFLVLLSILFYEILGLKFSYFLETVLGKL